MNGLTPFRCLNVLTPEITVQRTVWIDPIAREDPERFKAARCLCAVCTAKNSREPVKGGFRAFWRQQCYTGPCRLLTLEYMFDNAWWAFWVGCHAFEMIAKATNG